MVIGVMLLLLSFHYNVVGFRYFVLYLRCILNWFLDQADLHTVYTENGFWGEYAVQALMTYTVLMTLVSVVW